MGRCHTNYKQRENAHKLNKHLFLGGTIASISGLLIFSISYLGIYICEQNYISCVPVGGVQPFWSGLLIVLAGLVMIGFSLRRQNSSPHEAISGNKDETQT